MLGDGQSWSAAVDETGGLPRTGSDFRTATRASASGKLPPMALFAKKRLTDYADCAG